MSQKFFTGDVVKHCGSSFWKKGQQHIVNKCEYQGVGIFEYSTNRGAWFDSSDFTLVRRADRESFKELDKHLQDEEE